MRLLVVLAILLLWGGLVGARPPPREQRHRDDEERKAADGEDGDDDDAAAAYANHVEDLMKNLEYGKYLEQVVAVLEENPEFRKKLANASQDKIKDGSIAHELDFSHHSIRSKLDELKAKEVDRLQKLAAQQHRKGQRVQRPGHVNVIGDKTFQADDLKKLMVATNKDIDEIYEVERKDFKKYEMEKRFEKEERLKHIKDEEARKAEEERLRKMEEKHKDHEKLKHPMSKDQLEEVWEEEDHMRPEDFDSKTFFKMHDHDSNGFLDPNEIKALFLSDVQKAYDPKNPEDDMRERDQELENMQHHVYKEVDKNKDGLISFDEFMDETKQADFENPPEWETIDEERAHFDEEEYRRHAQAREREIRDSIDQGVIPPGYPYYMDGVPQGAEPYNIPPPNFLPAAGHPDLSNAPRPRSVPGQPNFQPNLQPNAQPSGQAVPVVQQPAQAPNVQQPGQVNNQPSNQQNLNPAAGQSQHP